MPLIPTVPTGDEMMDTTHDPADLHQAPEIWLTPFWFRVFVAILGVIAAVLTAFALASVVSRLLLSGTQGESFRVVVGSGLALLLSIGVIRFLNPHNRRRWFRMALTPEGLCLPARDSGLILVPWPAIGAIDVERWYGKGGEHSAARLALDLDEDTWPRFTRDARVDGDGRVRRISIHIVDTTGDELAARIRAYRDSQPDSTG